MRVPLQIARRRAAPRSLFTLTLLALAACGDSGSKADASSAKPEEAGTSGDGSAAATEAGSSDSGHAHDGGKTPKDAQIADATTDSGSAEAGVPSYRAQVCGDTSSWPSPLPPSNQRTAQPVGSDSFSFIEGPVWIAGQSELLFSNIATGGDVSKGPASRIMRLSPPATFSQFNGASNSNGLAFTAQGQLLAATHDNQGLSRFNLQTGARTPILVLANGKHLNSPNDLAVRSDGKIYLTDPNWQLGSRTPETQITGVYRVDPPLSETSANEAVLVDGTLNQPNGVTLSPDEQTLYVGSAGNEIWKYPVRVDGSLGARTKFADTGASDGLTVDCAGNVYVTSATGTTVQVFAPGGTQLGEISLAATPTNVAFGGADRKTLYITAGTRLYAIAMNVPGFPY